MKFTYVGEAARKNIQVSTGEICVMEKGVAREVPEEVAKKLINTPEYVCDNQENHPKAEKSAEKASERHTQKAHK